MAESSKDPLQTLREHTRRELGFMMGALLVHGESSLLAQARQARGSAEQAQCNEAIRELRLKGRSLHDLFLESVLAVFDESLRAKSAVPAPGPSRMTPPASAPAGIEALGVVKDAHLEQQIVTGNIAGRAMHQHREALLGIGRELARRSGSRRVDIESLPIGPQKLAAVFMDACTRTGVEPGAIIGFSRLFTRFVIDELGPFYQSCLEFFPVEPEPEAPLTTAPLGTPSASVLPVAITQDESPAPVPLKAAESETWDVAATPLVLPPGKAMAMSRNQLDDGLFNVQEKLLDPDESFLTPNPERGVQPLPVQELLNEALVRLGFTRPMSLSAEVVEMLAQVRLLFGRALADSKVPAGIRQMTRLLEVPFIRLALREPEALSLDTHPARMLFAELGAAAAKRPGAGDPECDDFARLVRLLVMRVLGDYDKDSTVFQAVVDDLRRYLAVHGTPEERSNPGFTPGTKEPLRASAPRQATPARPPASPEFQTLVDRIPLEGWIELRPRGAERRRLQLVARVPRTSMIVFADDAGQKAGEWSRNDLASMIENGEAVILKTGGTQNPGRR